MQNCSKCSSIRLVKLSGKCSDMCSTYLVNDSTKRLEGYVPYDMNVKGGDYIAFTFCLNCGTI